MKFCPLFLSLAGVLTLSGCVNLSSTPQSKGLCEKAIIDYLELRDNGSPHKYAELFTESAVFTVPKLNQYVKGKQALQERVAAAQATSKTQHMLASSHIYLEDKQLKGSSHFILYMKRKDKPSTTTVINGRYLDKFEIHGNKCLISERVAKIDRMENW